MIRRLRDEAILLLDRRGAILDVARDVTRVLREQGIDAAVIGGIAVVLHGHVRTTVDVDVLVPAADRRLAEVLKAAGYSFSRAKREFSKDRVPVHLVPMEQLRTAPRTFVEIDGVRTVGLADLIGMKLELGLRDPLRAQDLADVIGLIRARRLTPTFAAKLDKSLRPDFRKLARAIRQSR